MKIAGVQMDIALRMTSTISGTMIDRLRETTASGAHLMSFPNALCAALLFRRLEEARPVCRVHSGPATERMREGVCEWALTAIFGLLEPTAGIYNAAVLVGPTGVIGSISCSSLPGNRQFHQLWQPASLSQSGELKREEYLITRFSLASLCHSRCGPFFLELASGAHLRPQRHQCAGLYNSSTCRQPVGTSEGRFHRYIAIRAERLRPRPRDTGEEILFTAEIDPTRSRHATSFVSRETRDRSACRRRPRCTACSFLCSLRGRPSSLSPSSLRSNSDANGSVRLGIFRWLVLSLRSPICRFSYTSLGGLFIPPRRA